MKSLPRIQSRPANNASQPIPIPAHPANPLNSAPKSPFRPHSKSHDEKNEKVKARNEVNLTSDNYGALSVLIRVHPSRLWLFQKKTFSPNEPNSGFEILSRARPLDTLLAYVSDPRRPASPPSPSGDQHAAAPGLTRFCKSNERTPAAIPAGFFIAHPSGRHETKSGLRS
jgi:hypothetical protein